MIEQKLQNARDFIKSKPNKKLGKNEYSHYEYFTPEQINMLVHEAEKVTGIFHKFDLIRDQNGYHGHLKITDIESGESITFIQATDIPTITATNISQQIGGAVTYTNRYMLMTAYDIADNSLDFDAEDHREKEEKVKPTANGNEIPKTAKSKISHKAFNQLCDRLKNNKNQKENGNYLTKIRRYYLPFDDEQEKIIAEICDNN